MKKALLALILAVFAVSAVAQTSFNINANAISLPNGKSTIAGTDAGLTLAITPNFSVFDRNILGSAGAFQYYGGGFQYNLPVLSSKLNNSSPNLDGSRFQFFLKASAGEVRVPTANHYGFTAGGGVNYDLKGTGTWAFGGSVEYAKFPGYANNTWIAEVGPSLHF